MLKSPFFIVGCARSGTTLLRTMLNNHPDIAIPLESLFIIDYLIAQPKTDISTMKHLISKEFEVSEWGLKVSENNFNDSSTAKELIDSVHNMYMHHHGKKFWGQKTPRFVRYGELLKSVYPYAKFVHIIRDPRAVVNSLKNSNVHRSNAYYGALRWKIDTEAGLKLKNKYSKDVLEIHYEKLVCEPINILKQVCEFLDIDFSKAMLDYHKTPSTEYGSYYKKVHSSLKQPPDQFNIDAWRDKLSNKEISLIEFFCGKKMSYWGYELETKAVKPSMTYLYYLKCHRILGAARQITHYLIFRPNYLICNLYRKYTFSLLLRIFKNINY